VYSDDVAKLGRGIDQHMNELTSNHVRVPNPFQRLRTLYTCTHVRARRFRIAASTRSFDRRGRRRPPSQVVSYRIIIVIIILLWLQLVVGGGGGGGVPTGYRDYLHLS